MKSPTRVIGSLVYRTREALNNNAEFMDSLQCYEFAPNCLTGGCFWLWHYPGTPSEISEVLTKITNDNPVTGSRIKFPSILDIVPIRQQVGDSRDYTFNLAIAGTTKSGWLTEQREVQVFDLLLRPVYEEFLHQINTCGYFQKGYGEPQHTCWEVFTTGSTGGKIIEMYGEHIDAIELHNLTLTLKSSLCSKDYNRIEWENEQVTSEIKTILNF